MAPGIVAGLRHAEHACHRGDRKAGLVRAHEPEEPDGIMPVSRSNQAVARERMSRSRRSCLLSRAAGSIPRARPCSGRHRRQALPPGDGPAHRPGPPNCGSPGTRVRIREPDRPDARPARTSSTMAPDSAHRAMGLGHKDTSRKASSVSTKPGQLQVELEVVSELSHETVRQRLKKQCAQAAPAADVVHPAPALGRVRVPQGRRAGGLPPPA